MDLERRLSRVERQLRFANKQLEATVEQNDDPDGRNRVRVSCPDVYGEEGLSPWFTSRSEVNGAGFGTIFTPKVGSKVYITLRDGNPDVGEYFGGPRGLDSTVPEEFQDVNVNGLKTASNIVQIFDDNTGEYTIRTESGKIVISADGVISVYGAVCRVYAPSELNADDAQYGIVTSSPSFLCPFSGKPHAGSSACKASD